jgi:hypothetical protein
MFKELNNLILREARQVSYVVADSAPDTERSVFSQGTELKIWSGASDCTIFQDASVNHAFRALHDKLHVVTKLPFTIEGEIELGRIQANQYQGLMADLVYIEVAEQVKHYAEHGSFVVDQVEFTLNKLREYGYKLAA